MIDGALFASADIFLRYFKKFSSLELDDHTKLVRLDGYKTVKIIIYEISIKKNIICLEDCFQKK